MTEVPVLIEPLWKIHHMARLSATLSQYGHCPDCAHVFHTHAKLEKATIFSSFSLARNRIEIASTLEHTIVRYRDIGIVSANERSYLRGPVCLRGDGCLKPVLLPLFSPE